MLNKKVVPNTDERLDEKLGMAITRLKNAYVDIQDAMLLALSVYEENMARELSRESVGIQSILGGLDWKEDGGLIKMRETIQARIKAEESK